MDWGRVSGRGRVSRLGGGLVSGLGEGELVEWGRES